MAVITVTQFTVSINKGWFLRCNAMALVLELRYQLLTILLSLEYYDAVC